MLRSQRTQPMRRIAEPSVRLQKLRPRSQANSSIKVGAVEPVTGLEVGLDAWPGQSGSTGSTSWQSSQP